MTDPTQANTTAPNISLIPLAPSGTLPHQSVGLFASPSTGAECSAAQAAAYDQALRAKDAEIARLKEDVIRAVETCTSASQSSDRSRHGRHARPDKGKRVNEGRRDRSEADDGRRLKHHESNPNGRSEGTSSVPLYIYEDGEFIEVRPSDHLFLRQEAP